MFIPRHWAHVDGTVREPRGHEYALHIWGCSATSVAEARQDAQRRFDIARKRIEEGRLDSDRARERGLGAIDDTFADGDSDPRVYPYGRSLLREELLEEIPGSRGGTVAIRTRNRYGSQVLNAANALFLDIDLGDESVGLGARVMALFGRKPVTVEARALDRIRQALDTWRDASFRVYRTAAGFRVMATDRLCEPAAENVVALMRAAGTDPAFVTLCRVQKCFRARLTPKPFRVKRPNPPTAFPFASAADEARMRRWIQEYETASAPFAVCRLVEEIGPKRTHLDLARVVEIHDRVTRATSDLALA